MQVDSVNVRPLGRMEPPWMVYARSLIGLREIPGAPTAPVIAGWLQGLHAWWKDDETPWCGTFIAACLQDAGLELNKTWYRALTWESWGREVPAYRGMSSPVPPYGTICTMERTGGGHVFFLVGILKENGRLFVYALGGNQDNQVCVRRYPLEAVKAWRWPRDYSLPTCGPTLTVYNRLMENAAGGGSQA